MKTKQQHWTKTVAAAKAEESSAWSMIWAMAEEAFERDSTYKNISSGPVIEDIRLDLEAAGVTMSFDIIKRRALTGKMVHSATELDSEVLRSVPWSVVEVAVKAGATPEAAAAVIRESPTPLTTRAMRDHFRGIAAPGTSPSTRKFTDEKYMSALAAIAAHTMAERRGEYAPSPMARLAGSLLGEMLVGKVVVVDWDAQLAEMLEAG
jgi:hypothetical protein